jgi:hypothetical protein
MIDQLLGANGATVLLWKATLANPAGGSAGAAVTVAVSGIVDSFGVGLLPASGTYNVQVTPSQGALVSVSSKTASGFSITLTPLPLVTLAAGTFDVVVLV